MVVGQGWVRAAACHATALFGLVALPATVPCRIACQRASFSCIAERCPPHHHRTPARSDNARRRHTFYANGLVILRF